MNSKEFAPPHMYIDIQIIILEQFSDVLWFIVMKFNIGEEIMIFNTHSTYVTQQVNLLRVM